MARATKPLTGKQAAAFLAEWKARRRELQVMSEDDLEILLQAERFDMARFSVMQAIHARYNIMRKAREVADLRKVSDDKIKETIAARSSN